MSGVAAAASETQWATRYAQLRRRSWPVTPGGVRALARSAYLRAGGAVARAPAAGVLRCLYLHAVYDDQVGRFRRLLRHLGQLGSFVTADQALEILAGVRQPEGPAFHLSFDDGFDNNYRNAFPVLEELGVQATFFVPTAFIGAPDHEILAGWWDSRGVPRPTRTMRWEWLREMSDAGHEIASHTRRHRRLGDISDSDVLRDEIEGSKRDIEDALGRRCRFISWPFGTYDDFGMQALAVVVDSGYEACFSAVRGRVEPGRADRWVVPRHHFESHWPWWHVRYFASGGGE